ncbi:TPA: hypothetical protein QBF85_004954 [Escherichia coli O128AC:H2]|nr:hypothetical protein [Escherichia coli O128AC:H2]
MRKRKGDGVTSGTDAPESHRARTRRSHIGHGRAGVCQHGLPESVSMVCRSLWRLSFRWWLRLSGMTDTTPLVLWCWLVMLRSLV